MATGPFERSEFAAEFVDVPGRVVQFGAWEPVERAGEKSVAAGAPVVGGVVSCHGRGWGCGWSVVDAVVERADGRGAERGDGGWRDADAGGRSLGRR